MISVDLMQVLLDLSTEDTVFQQTVVILFHICGLSPYNAYNKDRQL